MTRFLPESHTDFVFAVTGSGVALGLVPVALFVFIVIVIRMLIRANRNDRT